jgi:hypothetical protein
MGPATSELTGHPLSDAGGGKAKGHNSSPLGWTSIFRHVAVADLFMANRMDLFAGDWRLIDTAPPDQDVTLLVTDGVGPYRIPFPCKLTAAGWVNSKGIPLAVTPLQWRPYNPPRRWRPP